jgi:hypothetical protein
VTRENLRLELYAGNLHTGGAIGVAAQLLDHFIDLRSEIDWASNVTFIASTRVVNEMANRPSSTETKSSTFTVRDDMPQIIPARNSGTPPDIRLTIFGPSHIERSATIELTGFADGTLVPASPNIVKLSTGLGARQRARRQFSNLIKLKALKQYDGFIVQSHEMAGSLVQHVKGPIWVVANRPADLFRSPELWTPVELPPRAADETRLFYPARGYPHKNHQFIPKVCHEYASKTGRRLRIVTTLNDREVASLFGTEPNCIINVGEITVAQCATLYSLTDGLFFPSLNETASSAPLEAIAMGRPVIASDLDFALTATGGNGFHYRAHNASQAAEKVELATSGSEYALLFLANAKRSADSLGTAQDQAMEYLDIFEKVLSVREIT